MANVYVYVGQAAQLATDIAEKIDSLTEEAAGMADGPEKEQLEERIAVETGRLDWVNSYVNSGDSKPTYTTPDGDVYTWVLHDESSSLYEFGHAVGEYTQNVRMHAGVTFANKDIEVSAKDAENTAVGKQQITDELSKNSAFLENITLQVEGAKNDAFQKSVDGLIERIEDEETANRFNKLNLNGELSDLISAIQFNYEAFKTANDAVTAQLRKLYETYGEFNSANLEQAAAEKERSEEVKSEVEAKVTERRSKMSDLQNNLDSQIKQMHKATDVRGMGTVTHTLESYTTALANNVSEHNSGEIDDATYFQNRKDIEIGFYESNSIADIERRLDIVPEILERSYFSNISSHAKVGSDLFLALQDAQDSRKKSMTNKAQVTAEVAERQADKEKEEKEFEDATVAYEDERKTLIEAIKAKDDEINVKQDEVDAAVGEAKGPLFEQLITLKTEKGVFEFSLANIEMGQELRRDKFNLRQTSHENFIAQGQDALSDWTQAIAEYETIIAMIEEDFSETAQSSEEGTEKINVANGVGEKYAAGDDMTPQVYSLIETIAGTENIYQFSTATRAWAGLAPYLGLE